MDEGLRIRKDRDLCPNISPEKRSALYGLLERFAALDQRDLNDGQWKNFLKEWSNYQGHFTSCQWCKDEVLFLRVLNHFWEARPLHRRSFPGH